MVQPSSRKSFPVSWDQFHRDARALAWRLADKGPFEAIVCITRGGLVPAAIVARELELKLVETVCVASYHDYLHQGEIKVLKTIAPSIAAIGNGKGKGVLLIDDLTDTGKTAKLVRDMLPDAHFATVYAKPAGAPMCHTFITEVSQDTWIFSPGTWICNTWSPSATERVSRAMADFRLTLRREGIEDLEHLVTIVIGLAIGLWLAARAGWTLHWPWPAQPAPRRPIPPCSATPAHGSPAETATTAAAASLSARLHALEAVFSPLASNLAHPRELEDQPQFAEAVKLLEDPGVPLDTVMQYALGANWALACAALAALKKRADRSERVDEVVAHFDKLYPWPMYFALDYLLAVEPRPPVGDPVAGAKDWWGDNLIVPGLFRDYFAKRESLGDAPVFGPALERRLRLAAGADPGVSSARHPPLSRRRSCGSSTRPARQRRPHLPRLVRPLLGGPQGHRAADRARGVAGGAGGGARPPRCRPRRGRCW